MSAPSDAQIGHVEEDTFGVFKAPTTFNPIVSFDHGFALERLESEGVVAGLDIIGPDQWNGGNITIEPEIGFELYTAGLGIWLKHMFGAQSGAGPYEFTPGDIDSLPGLSIQAGVPRVSGAVVPVGLSGLPGDRMGAGGRGRPDRHARPLPGRDRHPLRDQVGGRRRGHQR